VIVVSDTSPLRYLAVLAGLEWLPRLFSEVVCPPEVLGECCHPHAPESLRRWALSPPPWLKIQKVKDPMRALGSDELLDPGETAALLLAREIQADLLLLDERKGRAVAQRLGLAVTGTVGVLVRASLERLVDFDQAIARLRAETNFRVDDAVIAEARRRLAQGLKLLP